MDGAMSVDARQLALTFSEVIRDWLDEDEIRHVIALNRCERDPLVCHTHDFCDANEAMAYSFRLCGLDPDVDGADGLWDEAWSLAKRSEFDSLKILSGAGTCG